MKFTNQELEEAIEAGIFDDKNYVTTNPAQVIRYFEKWAEKKAKEAHRNARHKAVEIINQHTHSQEQIEMEIDGEINIVEETKLIRKFNTPSVTSQIMNIQF